MFDGLFALFVVEDECDEACECDEEFVSVVCLFVVVVVWWALEVVWCEFAVLVCDGSFVDVALYEGFGVVVGVFFGEHEAPGVELGCECDGDHESGECPGVPVLCEAFGVVARECVESDEGCHCVQYYYTNL